MAERTHVSKHASPAADAHDLRDETVTIPVVEERLHVDRVQRTTGRVRVSKRLTARVAHVDVPVTRERVHVTRTRIERTVSSVPPVRHEGDTLVIPVVEERVVVEKRLFLREEVRITRRRSTTQASERVRLRSEHVEVEHIDEGGTGPDGDEPAAPRREPALQRRRERWNER